MTRRRRPLWRLAPWTRAPLLGLRQPAAVLAVLVTSAVLACAVASAPLFLSSARSAALQQQLAAQCAEAGWPQTGAAFGVPPGTPTEEVTAALGGLRAGWASEGRDSERVLRITRAIGAGGNPQSGMLVRGPDGGPVTQPANLFWRAGVTGQVE